MLHLRTLGRLQLLAPSGEVLEEEVKPLLVLARVSLHRGAPLGRAHWAGLFWPDAPEEKARQSLRQAIYRANQLTGGVVDTSGGVVRVDPRALRLDCTELEEALRRGASRDVADLWQGPFLRGWARRSGRELAHWIEATHERLTVGAQLSFARLVGEALAAGDMERARDWSERLVALNPLSERARRLEIETLARGGDVGAALMAYQEYAAVLERELGDAPGEELRARARALQKAADAAAPSASLAGTAGVLSGESSAPGAAPPRSGRRGLRAAGVGSVAVVALAGLSWAWWAGGETLEVPVWMDAGGGMVPGVLHVHRGKRRFEALAGPVSTDDYRGPGGRAVVERQFGAGVDLVLLGPDGREVASLATPADERALGWSPDGRWLLVSVGRAVGDGDGYLRELRVVDAETGALTAAEFETDLVAGERSAAWSPDGSTIAVVRPLPGGGSELATFDPSGEAFGVVPLGARGAREVTWSPDGRRLAVVVGDGRRSDLLLLDGPTGATVHALDDPGYEDRPQWLTRRHLATTHRTGGTTRLLIRDLVDEVAFFIEEPGFFGVRRSDRGGWWSSDDEPSALLRAAADHVLEGSGSRWVEEVEILGLPPRLAAGEIRDLGVRFTDRAGRWTTPLRPVRWSVTDTAVASVDSLGRLRAKAVGRTQAVGALPAWRADTVPVAVVEVTTHATPVLLEDDWGAGIREAAWTPVGAPPSWVVSGRGPRPGTPALRPAGDQNYSSGVVGAAFSSRRGLTLEVEGRIEITGKHFVSLGLGLVGYEPVAGDSAWVATTAPAIVAWADGRTGTVVNAPGGVPVPRGPGTWHRFALQLSSEGEAALVIDGVVRSRFQAREAVIAAERLRPALFGNDLNGEVWFGSVRLYEGERYRLAAAPPPSARSSRPAGGGR